MARSEEEDDTTAVDDADAKRASSRMRKWDLPPRLLCVYHYSNGSASKADGADVTYPQPSSKATPLLVVLEEQQQHASFITHLVKRQISLLRGFAMLVETWVSPEVAILMGRLRGIDTHLVPTSGIRLEQVP
jgi:hypothetical protein